MAQLAGPCRFRYGSMKHTPGGGPPGGFPYALR